MVDGWINNMKKTSTNFTIYYLHDLSFLKSLKAFDNTKEVITLCSLVNEVLEQIGVENVKQLVANNIAYY